MARPSYLSPADYFASLSASELAEHIEDEARILAEASRQLREHAKALPRNAVERRCGVGMRANFLALAEAARSAAGMLQTEVLNAYAIERPEPVRTILARVDIPPKPGHLPAELVMCRLDPSQAQRFVTWVRILELAETSGGSFMSGDYCWNRAEARESFLRRALREGVSVEAAEAALVAESV